MNAFFKSARTVLGTIWVWSLLLVLSCALLVWNLKEMGQMAWALEAG